MAKNKDKAKAAVLKALEKGKLKSTRDAAKEMRLAQKAAQAYLKKEARINIRLSVPDLTLLKRKAAEEGLPYQTLISSLLHKFVMGRLKSV